MARKLAALLLLMLWSSSAWGAGATGIYWLSSPDNSSGMSGALAQSFVDGAALRYKWATHETADGTFDFTSIDADLDTVIAANKKATISVTVGNAGTPCWVHNSPNNVPVYADTSAFDTACAGAPSSTFASQDATTNIVPIPWNATFQTKLGAFITALGMHLTTARKAAVVGVKVTGIGWNSQEVKLTQLDTDTAGWTAVGYTSANVNAAYTVFLNDWANAFPNAQLQSMYVQARFPQVDQPAGCSGQNQIFPRRLNDISYGLYASRTVMQYNGICAPNIGGCAADGNLLPQMCQVNAASPWQDCENSGAESCQTGKDYNTFQSGSPFTALQGLQENAALGSNSSMTMWNTAKAAFTRLQYIEVYPSDISDPTNAAGLTAAHNALSSPTLMSAVVDIGVSTHTHKYAPTVAAGLVNYRCPGASPDVFTTEVTDASAPCSNGTTPVGGGTNACRLIATAYPACSWVESSGAAATPTPTPGACTPGLVCDEVGMIADCSGTAGNTTQPNCTISHPVTADTTAGSPIVTVHGYTLSNADMGKHAAIGMNFGIPGTSNSLVGAGGNSSTFGQPLRVAIASVNTTLNNFVGTTYSGGSSTASAANTVTGANLELGTPNGAAIQTLINNNNSVTFGSGRMLMDSAVVIPSGKTLSCQAGAVFIDPRNDTYNGSNFGAGGPQGFVWQSATSGSFTGPCKFQQTNVYGPALTIVPHINRQLFLWGSSNITIGGTSASAPMQILTQVDDGAPQTYFLGSGCPSGSPCTTSNSNTMHNIIAWVGGAFGPSIIQGTGNVISNNSEIDGACTDVEPNNTAEANLTFNNPISNNVCFSDNKFPGDKSFTGNTTGHTGYTYIGTGQAAGCATSSTCSTSPGNTWTNNTAVGPVSVVDSGVPSMFKAGSNWSQIPNAQGSPGCDLSPATNCWNK